MEAAWAGKKAVASKVISINMAMVREKTLGGFGYMFSFS